jgi:c-di-GMP-binding flagellar brake protein YcgR
MTSRVEDSPFALHNPKEIVFVLEDLVKHRVAINLDTQEGVGLVTCVLGLSPEGSHVHMDISPDERVNEKILNSRHVSFVTQTGVKVRWQSSHMQLVGLPDGDAFSMPIPTVIERIQRREYFRLNTPQGSHALICKIPVDTGFMETSIVDLSVGGVGVSIRGKLHEIFSQGALLEGCSITLPEIGAVPTNLRVRGIWFSIKTKSGEQINRIGLEFEGLSRGAANVIQRYIIQLEAEKISLN